MSKLYLERLEPREVLTSLWIDAVDALGSLACQASGSLNFDPDSFNESGSSSDAVTIDDLGNYTSGLTEPGVGVQADIRLIGDILGGISATAYEQRSGGDPNLVSRSASVRAEISVDAYYRAYGSEDVPVGSQFVFSVDQEPDGPDEEIGADSLDVWAPEHAPRVGGLVDDQLVHPNRKYYAATVGEPFRVLARANASIQTSGMKEITKQTHFGMHINRLMPVQINFGGMTWTTSGVSVDYEIVGDLLPAQPSVQFFWTQDDPTSAGARGSTVYQATLADCGNLSNGTRYVLNIPASALGNAPFKQGYLAMRPPQAWWAQSARIGTRYEATPPEPPSISTIVVGNEQVTLGWSNPTNPFYSEITDYVVDYSADSGVTWHTYNDGVSSAPSVTVKGLSNGTAYLFRVAAVNRMGVSGFSGNAASGIPTHEIIVRAEFGQSAIDGPIRSGTTQLIKRGSGTLVLDKGNSHSGGTVVDEGEVVVRNVAGLGTGTLDVRKDARALLDVHGDNVSVGGLSIATGGLLDVGYGRLSIAAGGYALPDVLDLLRSGYASNWTGSSGVVSRTAGSIIGGGLGYVINDDGSLTVGFAASGDTNLDGTVDILDVSAMLASSKFNTGESASWSEGDSNYDGVIDILDISDLLGASLFNAGPYIPAQSSQAQPKATSGTLSALQTAFLALAADTGGSGLTPAKRLRFAGV